MNGKLAYMIIGALFTVLMALGMFQIQGVRDEMRSLRQDIYRLDLKIDTRIDGLDTRLRVVERGSK